ncbi:MAG: TetR/AcrR family transcriptional regulator, regulator of cefoperazone and chloramphenicol [Frankiales bacterium]|nr:TetR/AcrR family transcriptional regulator, regulator of cefoperazone and chloramphenicol [Frankiales bacterium]
MSVPSPPDARDRILLAALESLAERGERATTVRAVAAAAQVSPSLVIFHFGSKQGLRAAVDAAVLERFEAALASAAPTPRCDWTDLVSRLVGTVGRLVAVPAVRGYLRRALLEPEGRSDLPARALGLARRELDDLVAAGVVRHDVDREYAAVQLLMLVVGPLWLAPVLEPLLPEPLFSPEGVERRVRANVDLLLHGLTR